MHSNTAPTFPTTISPLLLRRPKPAPHPALQPALHPVKPPNTKIAPSAETALAMLARAEQLSGGIFQKFGWGPRQDLPYTSVHAAIEAQCRQQPEAPAMEHLGQTWSYARLDHYATHLAVQLRAQGLQHGSRVGIFLQRGFAMVVGILAVLKLGAAYVPQDAGVVPAPMLRHVMDSAGIQVVLSTAEFIGKLPLAAGEMALDVQAHCQATLPLLPPADWAPAEVQGSDLCYVLYTSGTTGRPNGVMVTHRNLCNILHSAPGNLGIRPGLRVGQVLNIGFDMAAWEILACLSHGATLVLRGKDITETARQINVLIATPSILARLQPSDCPQLQTIALAGEPCPRALAEAWAQQCAFYNGCGPTEVTIVNTLAQFRVTDAVLSIGTPTPNNTVYVLNEALQACAIGEVGEMWAGGDCVSAGYIGNAELTAERYRPDPFLGGTHRMFRTRDLVRWTANGQLEHLGRVDDQVKVRGFRVELDAVSAVLEASPGCKRAVTLKANDQDLVAFVTPATVDPASAQQRVRQALQYYCVPALVLALDELPITARGKVDKQALLALALPQLQAMQAAGAAA